MEMTIDTQGSNQAPSDEFKATFEDFTQAFEAYKESNDSRLASMEAGRQPDPLIEEKLARIEQDLDRGQQQIKRLVADGRSSGVNTTDLAHKTAFESYVRKGDVAKLTELERKAMSVGSEADGGYLVPVETETRIMAALTEESPIRGISGHLVISTATYKKPFRVNGAAAGWVGETAARPQTATPQLAELAFPTMELYAMPAATIRLLDDAAVDIDDWIADEVRSAFALQESQAFVSGDGVNRPKGFLSHTTVANNAWTWGKLGYVASGADAGLPLDGFDSLIDLVFALRTPYRKNARFVMNRLTQSAVRKLKDEHGNYLWQPPLQGASEPTLLGYPTVECDEMPDIASGSFSIAFGDFSRGYIVVDRQEIRVLRDPFSAKPYVLFYCTKRVGGGVQDFDAIKLMKFSES